MEGRCLLLSPPRPSPAFILQNPPLPSLHLQNPLFISQFRIICVPRCSRWDSNAENLQPDGFRFDEDDDEEDDGGFSRKKKKKRRQWWFDDDKDFEDEDVGILQEFVDSIWIFKVFSSFGWILPPIIVSLLVTTGPKAFLMALALPVGQSTLSFAFLKLFGKQKRKKKAKVKTSKNASTGYTSKVDMEGENEGEIRGATKKKMDNQTRVASNGGPVEEEDIKIPSFGGWDELDDRLRSMRSRPQKTNESESTTTKSRLSRKEKSQTPLLLRLLTAAFPFLGFWTKLFW